MVEGAYGDYDASKQIKVAIDPYMKPDLVEETMPMTLQQMEGMEMYHGFTQQHAGQDQLGKDLTMQKGQYPLQRSEVMLGMTTAQQQQVDMAQAYQAQYQASKGLKIQQPIPLPKMSATPSLQSQQHLHQLNSSMSPSFNTPNPDFSSGQPLMPGQMIYSGMQNVAMAQQPQQQPGKEDSLIIPTLPDFVTIDNSHLGEYIKNGINLQQIVAQAVDAAIQEIIPPVISRSVTIALITTRELALKDYSLEPNEKLVLRGTHLMVQKLSGSLALVTCREPLKMSLQNQLKKLIEKEIEKLDIKDKLNAESIEKIVQITTIDNLDLGCSLIRKAVMEKALEDVNHDTIILQALEKRKQFKDNKQTYVDEKFQQIMQILPEPLRPKPGGLTLEELKIYDDFSSHQSSSTGQQQQHQEKLASAGKPDNEQQFDIYKQEVLGKWEKYFSQPAMSDQNEVKSKLKQMEESVKEIQKLENMILELSFISVNKLFQQCDSAEKTQLFIYFIEILKNSKPQVANRISQAIFEFFKL